ncbi:hypothetical protein ZOSMA_42G00100 [Zostera marina]|uniref:Uncharacterized protein n=1 Tax=Zostera marina TaxID=29655 RepID=A0A0K9P449_ZOSMR|nr:hypothetical protein ZOSMA_42G00100 [Zostera marina]
MEMPSISLSLTSTPIHRRLISSSSSHFRAITLCPRCSTSSRSTSFSTSRIFSSMTAVEAPESTSKVSDRGDSDILQFVNYQGLGNDFILVLFV